MTNSPAAAPTGTDPARAQTLIDVRNLKKFFPIKRGIFQHAGLMVKAVDDVSFSLRSGETLGIVGESGCGKSTTARLLMHLIELDAGEIVLDGQAVGGREGLPVRRFGPVTT